MFKRNIHYFMCLQFMSYLAQGFAYCMLFTYLISLGYSATERSIMFSIGAAVGIIAQFVVGYLCDRNRTVKRYVYITHVIFALATIGIYMVRTRNFLLHTLFVGGLTSMLTTTVGLLDSWTLVIDEECNRRYGTIRAMGSISWSIGSFIGGYLVEGLGYSSLSVAHVISIAVLLFVASRIHDVRKEEDEPISMENVRKLLSNKTYMMAVLILFVLFVITICQDYVVVDKINYLGATERQVSWYWIVSAMLELPLFFYGNQLGEKLGLNALVIFTAVAYGVKYLLFAIVGSVGAMIAVSSLQFCTFPLLTIISKRLIEKESPDDMKVSAQQIGSSMYNGISALISPLIAGLLEDGVGVDPALYIISSLSVVALLLTFRYITIIKTKSLNN